MPINLTNVKHNLNNIKRNLFFEKNAVITFYDVNTPLGSLDSGWYCQKWTTSNLAIGAEYFELSVADLQSDSVNLEKIIPRASQVEFLGERYKIAQYFRPRGLTKEWLIRLQSYQEKDNG